MVHLFDAIVVCFFQADGDEPEKTPEEIELMVRSLASPSNRLILFLQQSTVEWSCPLWLHKLKEIDPAFRRTIIVLSKFDNRLKVCPHNNRQSGT